MRASIFKTRRASDAEIDDGKIREMVTFLRQKLSEKDFATLKELVGVSEEMGEDKRTPSVAADSALQTFAQRWPMVARIGLV